MHNFCKQCNAALFYDESNDFVGICDPDYPDIPVKAVCAGCGPTLIDCKGRCVGKCKGHFKQVSQQYSNLMAPAASLQG